MNLDIQRLIDIFLELVKISATSRREKPVADYIRTFLSNLGINVTTDSAGEIVAGNSGNVIACIPSGIDGDPVALVSHMDTVKPTEGIEPLVSPDRITSDGSTILGADNRAGVALILYTVEHLIRNGQDHRPFEVIFTIGEETGFYGSSHLDLDLIKSRSALILDSSASPGSYITSAPGALGFRADLIGKASHAAVHPDAGINSIAMAAELIRRLPLGQVDQDTTINIGTISGGEANNIIPPRTIIRGEIRSFSAERISSYYRRIEQLLDTISSGWKGKYELTEEMSFPGFDLNHDSALLCRTAAVFKKLGIRPEPMRYHGGSDANMFNHRGITALNLGIGAKNPHAFNEFILVEDLKTMSQFCLELLTPGD